MGRSQLSQLDDEFNVIPNLQADDLFGFTTQAIPAVRGAIHPARRASCETFCDDSHRIHLARHRAHVRRKFFDLHAINKSQIAEKALQYSAVSYEVEREVRELEPTVRHRIAGRLSWSS